MLSALLRPFTQSLPTAARRIGVSSHTALGILQIRKQSSDAPSSNSHELWRFLKQPPPDNTGFGDAATASRQWPRPQGPYDGRSVAVSKDKPFNNAYMELQQILRRNLVSYELRLAERHEKKGYKRRRLASDRHRRRFAHEVRKKVQLVNEIRARGA